MGPTEQTAPAPTQGGMSITITMSQEGVSLTTADGQTQAAGSIGEALQALLEIYEGITGGSSGESQMQAGYAGGETVERPIGGRVSTG